MEKNNCYNFYRLFTTIDLFGINYQFRVNNKRKHTSTLGGICTIIIIGFTIGFFLEKLNDFNEKSDIQMQYIYKNNDKLIMSPENFHFSINFRYKNASSHSYSNVIGTEFEKIFDINLEFHNLTRGGAIIDIKKIPRINCKSVDMKYNFPKNESENFLNNHMCFDYKANDIYGKWGDVSMTYIKFYISLNKTYQNDLISYNQIKAHLKKYNFRLSPFYSSKIIDSSKIEEPVKNEVRSDSFINLDMENEQETNFYFQKLVYIQDLNPFFNIRTQNEYIKYQRYESFYDPIMNRESNFDYEFIKIYLRPELKLEEIIITPKKFTSYLSEVLSVMFIILKFLRFIAEKYNHFQGKPKIISKLSNIDENLKCLFEGEIKNLKNLIEAKELMQERERKKK